MPGDSVFFVHFLFLHHIASSRALACTFHSRVDARWSVSHASYVTVSFQDGRKEQLPGYVGLHMGLAQHYFYNITLIKAIVGPQSKGMGKYVLPRDGGMSRSHCRRVCGWKILVQPSLSEFTLHLGRVCIIVGRREN